MRAIIKWFKDWFYIPKYEKVSDKSFSRIMLYSAFGILFCGICLASLTWAWFSNSVTSNSNNITAARFSAEIEFKQNGSVIEPGIENESYKLVGGVYTVTVTADGSASTGYCTVELKLSDNNINTYHTVQLSPTGVGVRLQSVEFTVNVSDVSYLKITPQWGTYAKPDNEELIGNSEDDIDTIPLQSLSLFEAEPEEAEETEEAEIIDEIEEAPTYQLTESEQSYTVQEGDSLFKIADRYGTTVDILSAYNNITNTGSILTGSIIKIPPASYRVPETTTAQPATTENATSEPTAVDAPAVDAPAVDAPTVDAPAIEAPAVEAPAVDAPESETPQQAEESSSAVSTESSSQESEPAKPAD